MPSYDATIVIATRNRLEDLRAAVASALQQRGQVEVLVIDDGSTDGTAQAIRAEYPAARVERSEQSLGYIIQRNRGATMASAPIIISIDDDAVFSTPEIVAQTLAEFTEERISVIAIPFINVRDNSMVHQRAPSPSAVFIAESYIGTAHAMRRADFLDLGGYREHLLHQCEEEDYSIRLLERGKLVRLGNADPIHHFESPRRDRRRLITNNARNHLLFGWHNVPMPYYPVYVLATTFNLLRYGVLHRRVGWTIQGLARGWRDTLRYRRDRHPVSGRVYRLSRRLKRRRATPLDELR